MRHVAVAFSTTGPSPKAGHRISEMVLVAQEVRKRDSDVLKLDLNDGKFPVALEAMKTFVGDSTVVVHNAGKWRSFLRVELRKVKRHGAGKLLSNIIDLGAWAHQRFPRQRRDVLAIARRMGIEAKKDLTGLELEAELLRLIAAGMNTSGVNDAVKAIDVDRTVDSPSPIARGETLAPPVPVQRDWVERIGCFWRKLVGKM